MRAPFRNDPRDPWDDDEIGAYYRNGHGDTGWPQADVDLDRTPPFPFGFQPPQRRRTTTRPPSRQARAATRRATR